MKNKEKKFFNKQWITNYSRKHIHKRLRKREFKGECAKYIITIMKMKIIQKMKNFTKDFRIKILKNIKLEIWDFKHKICNQEKSKKM